MWYDRANATFTTLIDTKHAVSSAYQFINVPMGIWIDERGRVVRPAEPAWTESRMDTFRRQEDRHRRRGVCCGASRLGEEWRAQPLRAFRTRNSRAV